MNIAHLVRIPFAVSLLACSAGPSQSEAPQPATASAAANSGGAAPVSAAVSAAAGSSARAASSLTMPPLADGFQRFIASPVPVPSGTTDDWIQWVSGPTDQDYDVMELKGAQSKGGHHALMLSISEPNPPGTTRKYTERDQLTSSSVGGIGAEGNVAIPEGVVFRLRKGSYLAIQAHYLNTSEQDIMGETYIDIKMTPSSDANTVAGHFASTSVKISLPPKTQSNMDVYCDVEEDLHILRMTNHMHYAGASTFTEYTDPSGMVHMLKKDDVWSEDWALTPNYDNFPVAAPLLIPAGSQVHTHCVWQNNEDKPLTFPEEMCVFATIILGEREISCIDGKFAARSPGASAAAAPPVAGSPASAPAAGAAGAAGTNPTAATGACDSADRAIVDAPEFQDVQRMCGSMCLGSEESCATACLTKNTMLTAGCAACNGAKLSCAMMHCIGDCASGFASASCMPCLETNCGAAYHACSGL